MKLELGKDLNVKGPHMLAGRAWNYHKIGNTVHL